MVKSKQISRKALACLLALVMCLGLAATAAPTAQAATIYDTVILYHAEREVNSTPTWSSTNYLDFYMDLANNYISVTFSRKVEKNKWFTTDLNEAEQAEQQKLIEQLETTKSAKCTGTVFIDGDVIGIRDLTWEGKPFIWDMDYYHNYAPQYVDDRFVKKDGSQFLFGTTVAGTTSTGYAMLKSTDLNPVVTPAPEPAPTYYTFFEDSFSFDNSVASLGYTAPAAGSGDPAFGTYGSAASKWLVEQLCAAAPAYQKAIAKKLGSANSGVCQGMSAVNGLIYQQTLKLSQFSSTAKNAYALQAPKNNQTLQEAILYYHLLQNTDRMQSKYNLRDLTMSSALSELEKQLKANLPEMTMLFSFETDDWAHMVLAYDYDEASRVITCYDPNDPAAPLKVTIGNHSLAFSQSSYDGAGPREIIPVTSAYTGVDAFNTSLKAKEIIPQGINILAPTQPKIDGTPLTGNGPINDVGEHTVKWFVGSKPRKPITLEPEWDDGEEVVIFWNEGGGCGGITVVDDAAAGDKITITPDDEIICVWGTRSNHRRHRVNVAVNDEQWIAVESEGDFAVRPVTDGGYEITGDKPITIVITDPAKPGTVKDTKKDADASKGLTVGGGEKAGKCRVEVNDSKGGTYTAKDDGTLTIKANEGYKIDAVTLNGKTVTGTKSSDGTVTLTGLKATDTVKITFAKVETAPVNKFIDVPDGAFYKDAVLWAVERGITNGTGGGYFSPYQNCNRAQIVTFLWRLAGEPRVSTSNPFSDVPSDAFYYNAVLWAVEKGITNGTGGGCFSPYQNCNRAQIVTFLWRYYGQPGSGSSHFSDVPNNAYFKNAVDWAAGNGITTGTGNGLFSPAATCTRGQGVTFLYRADQLPNAGSSSSSSPSSSNASPDGDTTGWSPSSWSWTRAGTEGYGLAAFTSGKYVRSDGKAVLYIESSDSPDFISYQLYIAASGSKKAYEVGAWGSAESNLQYMDDFYHNISFEDNGSHKITVTNFWLDAVEDTYSSPDGVYTLVREK